MRKQIYAGAAIVALTSGSAFAQSKIKDGTVVGSSSLPNANAVLELESTKRGLLMPRVALQGTAFPSPLTAHIAGMVVYNTATATDVSPGYYYNDGTQWRKMAYVSPSASGGTTNLTNDNGIIVTGGTGATLTNASLRLDSTAVAKFIGQSPVKDSIAMVLSKSPVKDSLASQTTQLISGGAISGKDLTNGNGIIVIGGTGTSLKATSLRLDSTAVAKFISQSPVKDSIATVLSQSPVKDSLASQTTQLINGGDITGKDLTNANGIIVTGGVGTSLKATSLRLDSTAVAKMISQSPVKDSIATVLSQSPVKDSLASQTTQLISGGAINGKDLTNANGIIVSGGTGTSLKATSLRLDSTAVAKFIGQSPVKDSIATVLSQSPVKDSLASQTTQLISGGAINGKDLTNGNGIIVTGGIGTSLKATSLRLDSTAVAKFINQSPVRDSIAVAVTKSPVIDSINKSVTNIYNANGSLVSNRTVAQGSNTLAFTATATNAFSVDGSTFSVDALNNRVGIGTASPEQQLDVNGNIQVGGASRRILSDFSNSTQAQRTFFQTTTTNGETHVSALPNGTATAGSFSVFNGTDPDNSSRAQLLINNTAAEIRSNATGTGTVRPFMIRMGTTPNVLRVETSGNVGINNSAPTERLDVTGNIKFSGALMPNNDPGTAGQVLQSTGTGAAPTWTTLTTANTPNIYTADASITASRVVDMPSSRTLAFTPSGTQVVNQFSVDGTTFSVDALNDRVGIGTTSPGTPLEVNGTIRTFATGTGYASMNLGSATTNGWVGFYRPNGTRAGYIGNATNGNMFYDVDPGGSHNIMGGNVGIGTTSPTERLDVSGSVKFSGALMPNNAAGTAGQVLQSAGTGAAPTWTTLTTANTPNIYTADASISANRVVDMPSSRTLAFSPSGTQVANQFSVDGSTFSVDALNDRVGIGTTSPNAPLAVQSSTPGTGQAIATLNGGRFAFNDEVVSTSTGAILDIAGANTPQIRNNSGSLALMPQANVGIGTTNPTRKLHVNGDMRLTGNLYDGNNAAGASGQVLSSDGTKTTWVNNTSITPTVIGVLSTTLNSNGICAGTNFNTGTYIDLPPGKWTVQGYFILNAGGSGLSSGQAYWVRAGLSTSASSFVAPTYITSATQFAGSLVGPSPYGAAAGSILINNTTGSTQRLYLWRLACDTGGIPCTGYGLTNFGNNLWGENSLFASPIN